MIQVSGPLCPLKDGRHKLKPLYNLKGFACVRCSKTWEWMEGKLIATYDKPDLGPDR